MSIIIINLGAPNTMNNTRQEDDMSKERPVTETARELVCDKCGRPAEFEIGGIRVCGECYELYGSCCVEFGGYDLWREDGPPEPKLL